MKWNLTVFAILLAIVLAIWLGPSVFSGKVLLPLDILWQCPPIAAPPGVEGVQNFLIGDMLYENFTWKTLLRRCVANGEWPLWNPYAFCGHPLYATGQASTFYPFNAIFLLLPLSVAYTVYTGLHLWLGGVFQYLLLRRLGLGGFASGIGGLVFAMCGFFAMRLIWPMLLGSAIWLPLMLLWIIRLSESENVRQAAVRVAGGAVIFALPLLSGFFEIAFYAYFTAGLFTLARCWHLYRATRSPARCFGLCAQSLAVVIVAVLLSGPQLCPFMEVKDLNLRAGQVDYDKMVGRALHAEHLLPMAIPDIFGHPAKKQAWDLRDRAFRPIHALHDGERYSWGSKNYSENGYYLGLLPLLLVPLSLRVRGHHRVFLWVLLILSVLLAFGTPIYAAFFNVVPGFEQVRTPFRWMYPATFAIAGLAAIGAQRWQTRLDAPVARRSGRMIWVLLSLPVTLLFALVVLLAVPSPAHRLAEQAIHAIPGLTRGWGFGDAWDLAGFMWANLFRFSVFLLAAMIVITLPVWRTWRGSGVCVAALACFSLLAVDVGQANYRFNTHSDPAWLNRSSPEIEFLRQDDGVFRVARFKDVVLHPNLPTVYGLQDVGGYDSILLSDYVRYLSAIEEQRSLWWNQIVAFNDISSLDSPLFSLLNVRYLMTCQQIDHPDWELVFSDRMRIYRNRKERPRAFVVHQVEQVSSLDEAIEAIGGGRVDPTTMATVEVSDGDGFHSLQEWSGSPGRVEVARYGHTAVELKVDLPETCGLVTLCDMMYPGWQAYVDDAPADILKVNGIFRGVFVPPGHHQVAFRFEPASLRRGWMLLGMGLVVMIVGIVLSWALSGRPSAGQNVSG